MKHTSLPLHRRAFIAGLGSAAAVTATAPSGIVHAQSFPNRLIKIVVPFPAGGPTDGIGRVVAQQLSLVMRQSVIIENQASAGGRLGAQYVARSTPDGYTLLLGGTNSNAVPHAFYDNLSYDPIKDFIAVASIASDAPVLLVAPSVPAKSVEELVRYARENPGRLTSGAAVGIYTHFWLELFRRKANIEMVFVPYKGGAPAITDLLSGQIQVSVIVKSNVLPLIRAGRIRAIAVASAARWSELPDVPTMHESGLDGFPSEIWFGLVAPVATPAAIVETLNAAVNKALRSPEMTTSLSNLGLAPKIGTPKDFATILADDARTWEEVAKGTGLKVD